MTAPGSARLAARDPGASPLWVGATAAVVAMCAVATGDALLAAVLLGVAAGRVGAGAVAVLAAAASLVRWGSPSLAAMGADQAVLGAAGVVGPSLAAASAWCGAAAIVIAPAGRPLAALAAGSFAALLVAGPTDADGWWVRVVATIVAVALAWSAARVVPKRFATAVSAASAAAAFALAVVA